MCKTRRKGRGPVWRTLRTFTITILDILVENNITLTKNKDRELYEDFYTFLLENDQYCSG